MREGAGKGTPDTYVIHVGWTSHRPLAPDEHWSAVEVDAATAEEAEITAHGMVHARPECQMVTSILHAI